MKKRIKNKSNALSPILGVNMYPNIGINVTRIDILRRRNMPIKKSKRKNKTQKKDQRGGIVEIMPKIASRMSSTLGRHLPSTISKFREPLPNMLNPIKNIGQAVAKDRIQKELNPTKSIIQQSINPRNNYSTIYENNNM